MKNRMNTVPHNENTTILQNGLKSFRYKNQSPKVNSNR